MHTFRNSLLKSGGKRGYNPRALTVARKGNKARTLN
jgi:hypothetical protein